MGVLCALSSLSFVSTNVGTVTNKGMELSINAIPIQNKNFKWDMTLNIAGNRGTVSDLLTGQDVLYVTDAQFGNTKAASFNELRDENGNITQEGMFMGISGSEWARDEQGNVVLDWNTGMPTSNGKTTLQVGNREPSFAGGFNNSLQYKGWNLSFLFDYRVGGDVFNGTDYFLTQNGMSNRSVDRESLTISGVSKNPVTNELENKSVTYEAGKMYEIKTGDKVIKQSGESLIQSYYQNSYHLESTNYITKTNWLRLRALSLSYSLSDNILKGQNVVKGVTATVSGTNLWLWTNYKGMDPEASAAGSGVVGSSSAGMDYCGVPSTAGVSFGINITF